MSRAPVLLVFGRGVCAGPDGYRLSTASAQRVAAAVHHAGPGSLVIFSGGWSSGQPEPPSGFREGDLMLALARHLGLDRRARLVAETRSRTTLENLVRVVQDGLLSGRSFDVDGPLGLVSHAWHLPRIRYLAGKVLRLPARAMVDIPAPGTGSDREVLLRLGSRLCFAGVRAPQRLIRRERLLTHIARPWRGIGGR